MTHLQSRETNIRLSALKLLARREHSYHDLKRKLLSRSFPEDEIILVLDDLIIEGSLSDQRFVEHFLRYNVQRGYGPNQIRQKLLQYGVSEALIKEGLSSYSAQWMTEIEQVYRKKFKNFAAILQTFSNGDKHKAIAKVKRFLQYRGFTLEQIQTFCNESDLS